MSNRFVNATQLEAVQGSTPIISTNVDKLGRLQAKVLALLAKGGMYSAADISVALRLSDPRGHIAELRGKGYPIADIWVTTQYGNRYKKYFLKQ